MIPAAGFQDSRSCLWVSFLLPYVLVTFLLTALLKCSSGRLCSMYITDARRHCTVLLQVRSTANAITGEQLPSSFRVLKTLLQKWFELHCSLVQAWLKQRPDCSLCPEQYQTISIIMKVSLQLSGIIDIVT